MGATDEETGKKKKKKEREKSTLRAYKRVTVSERNGIQELCERRCGRLGLPVFNSPYGLCGRKATPQILTKILDLKFLHKFRTSNFCINSGPQIPT